MLSRNIIASFGFICSYLKATANSHVIHLHHHAQTELLERGEVCTFDVNPDFYGLGIRLGIYLQWLTSCIVLCVWWKSYKGEDLKKKKESEQEVSYSIAAGLIFLLSVFIALVISTSQNSIHLAEFAILLYICLGSLSSLLLLAYALMLEELHFGVMRHVFHTLLVTAISSFNLWFWFKGADSMSNKDCDVFLFLFVKVNILGPARFWFKVQSILVFLYSLFMFGLAGYYFIRKYKDISGNGFVAYLLDPESSSAPGQSNNTSPSDYSPPNGPWTAQQISTKQNPMAPMRGTNQLRAAASGEVHVTIARNAVKLAADGVIECAKKMPQVGKVEGLSEAVGEAESSLSEVWRHILSAANTIEDPTQDIEGELKSLEIALETALAAFYNMKEVVDTLDGPKPQTDLDRNLPGTLNHCQRMEDILIGAKQKFHRDMNLAIRIKNSARYIIYIMILVTVGNLWWSVIAIELTLVWNSISGVNVIRSTGQWIPFLASIGGLARIIFVVLKKLVA
ncbi:hypothetical protein BDZ45DRAFT_62702 [Acephala macrosclerotiorum]|nr:hypothetical protein BDZ45DRAFT_62702 [Acephala macrosclerotiorum]